MLLRASGDAVLRGRKNGLIRSEHKIRFGGKMKISVAAISLVMGIGAGLVSASSPCPAVGNDTNGCEYVITVTAVNGAGAATTFSVALMTPDQGPYDGAEDTLIGIINNSSGVLKSITLTNANGQFGFESDGACIGTFTPGPTAAQCLGGAYQPGGGPTGPDYLSLTATSFSNITASSGTVNFNNIPIGGTSWFSLEGALNAAQIAPGTPPITPAPSSLVLLTIGFAALTLLYFARGKFVRAS